MACTTVTITSIIKKYACVNNICTETPTGTYIDDPACGGVCKPASGDNTLIYLGIAALAGFLLLRKK